MRKTLSAIFASALLSLVLTVLGCSRAKEGERGPTDAAMQDRGAPAELAPQAPAAPQTITLAEGMPLKVRLIPTLSTATHLTGESFEAILVEPVIAGDRVIAPKGAAVTGTIVTADPGGRVKGVARIAVQLTRLKTGDGREIRISTSTVARQAAATKRQDAAKVGIGAGVGAAIGAIAGGGKGAAIGAAAGSGAGAGTVLVTRGKPAVLPSETVLTFKLRNPVEIPA